MCVNVLATETFTNHLGVYLSIIFYDYIIIMYVFKIFYQYKFNVLSLIYTDIILIECQKVQY